MIAVEGRETLLSDTSPETPDENPRDPWRHRPAYPGQLPRRSVGPGGRPARALPPEARQRGGHGGGVACSPGKNSPPLFSPPSWLFLPENPPPGPGRGGARGGGGGGGARSR